MASAVESLCHKDPNFAVICNFWDRYGEMIGLKEISYADLERWLEDTKQVSMPLIDIHVRLLRRIGKTSVTANRWERYIIKFCHTYSDVDAWEIEKFGYKHSKLTTKITLLKNLLEKQFDQNSTFKEKINKIAPEDMRFQAIGRDKNGLAYWYMLDNDCNLRVYREDQDDNDAETWEIVCKTRSDLAQLIEKLQEQIEGNADVKTEQSSASNSVKSEPIGQEEKLAASDDSQDSHPVVKKDPEKDKQDEVDGPVTKKEPEDGLVTKKEPEDGLVTKKEPEDGLVPKKEPEDEKKDVKKELNDEKLETKENEINEKKEDLEKEISDVEKDIKEETTCKEEKLEREVNDDKTEVKKESNDNKTEVRKELDNEGIEIKKEVKVEMDVKTESSAANDNKTSCDEGNKNDVVDSEGKEGSRVGSGGTEVDPKSLNDDGAKSDKTEGSNTNNSPKCNEMALTNIPKDSDKDLCTSTDSGDLTGEKDKSKHTANECETSDMSGSSNSKNKLNSESENKTETTPSCEDKNNSATSNLHGASCDNADTSVKCGCETTEPKGNNQGITNKDEICCEKNETNVNSNKKSQESHPGENNITDLDDENSQSLVNGELENKNNTTPSKSKSKVKGKKRPLLFEDNSTEDSPAVEPESKKSKPTKKVLTKKQPVKSKDSSEDTDDSEDIPLSQIKTTPKSSGKKTPKNTPKGKKGKTAEPTPTRKSSRAVRKKKFDTDEEEEALPKTKKAKGQQANKSKVKAAESSDEDNTPLKSLKKSEPENESEEDNGGRRRSSRVKKLLKAKKKEPSPPPSSFDEAENDEDSEFTVGSELDDSDDEFNPTPKGRNALRQAAIQEEAEEEIPNDTPCLHCNKTDRPEWLLLCDKCDDGYHTACLRPPLMIIPDGDWFCPPCEHKGLLEQLQVNLKYLDTIMKKKDRMIKRKERLAFVGISLDNILKDEHKENMNPAVVYEDCSDEDEYYRKPKVKKQNIISTTKRSCRSRNVISYKFDDFDDMINTAIKEDLENPTPYNPGKGRSRGKDMANIYKAEGREYISEDEGKPSPVGSKKKKKGRRLTNLSDDDDPDEDSGDEYKCTDDSSVSEPPEEEEEDDEDISDYSLDGEGWGRKGTRRSARRGKAKRYKDFIADEDEDSDFAPRRRSARSTRAATRQRRKYKEVWSEEEEEDLEEESDQSIDTDDLCSDESGPKKKQKNRAEIDKKVFKNSKKRRVDSGDESDGTEKSEESDSKSETDDSSVDIGKIKKAAKRKLSRRRYAHSSSESEDSESSEPRKQSRRTTSKKANPKSGKKSESESSEETEDSEEDSKRTKKKNVIRDDSTDTDDYYDEKKSDADEENEDEETEDEEKGPVKSKKQKKDEENLKKDKKDTEEKTVAESVTKNGEIQHKTEIDNDTESKKEVYNESESKIEENNEQSHQTTMSQGNTMYDSNTPENMATGSGVIRPSPLYSMGQGPPQGQQQMPSQQYGSPPHHSFNPSHGPYPPQQGPMGPPHSQSYPSQTGPNIPSSEFGPTSSPGSMQLPQYHHMQQRPTFTSSGPYPPGHSMYGRPNHPMMQNPPSSQDGGHPQQGQRPEMLGQMRGPYPMQDGQMMRGPLPGQQMMHGPYNPQQQQMMMMQGQYPRFPNEQIRGQHPGQYGGPIRGPYPNTSQQDMTNSQTASKEPRPHNQERMESGIRSPEHSMGQSFQSNPVTSAQFSGPHRPVARGPYPERPMMQNQVPFRPGISYPNEMRPAFPQGHPELQNRMSHPSPQSSPMGSPGISSPPSDTNRQFSHGNQPRSHKSQIPYSSNSQTSTSSTETTSSASNHSISESTKASKSSEISKTENDNVKSKKDITPNVQEDSSSEGTDKVEEKGSDNKKENIKNKDDKDSVKSNEIKQEASEKVVEKSNSDDEKVVAKKDTISQQNQSNSESKGSQSGPQNLRSPPPSQAQHMPMGPGPQTQGSMIPGPHPYQQGMFRGQFNEMMSQGGQRMPYQNVPMPQGPPGYSVPRPGNFMPRMGPEGPMHPQFQRPMYGPGQMYPQPGVPTSFVARPEMGIRMPQSQPFSDGHRDGQSKSTKEENQSEPTKAKKARKPRLSKKEKEKQAALAASESNKKQTSSSPTIPGPGFQPPPQMGVRQHHPYPPQMPMAMPMQGPYMRPPFDNYGMNGMNPQGPPEYNQMHPYIGPHSMPPNGGRGFMIDNLLEKQPRANQLEPIISQDDDDEQSIDPESSQQSYGDEAESPSNEKDMDEMSDIGDIVKYVMNH